MIAVIPCRKGSKGIPNKNFIYFCGKPLWMWTLDAALQSNVFDRIIVSSDNDELKYLNMADERLVVDYNCGEPFHTDTAQLDPLMKFYAHLYQSDTMCLLQPTSPLRTAEDIRRCANILADYDSVISVTSVGDKYWIKNGRGYKAFYDPFNRLNRQDPLTNVLYYENGAIYMTKTENVMKGSRIAGRVGIYEMPPERSHQIDSWYDLKVCEVLCLNS